MKIDLAIDCDNVHVEREGSGVKAELGGIEDDELFDIIEEEHLDNFIKRVGAEELLNRIGQDEAIEHFQIAVAE